MDPLVGHYRLRWLIDEYHQCLKSVCKVQGRRPETADRPEPLVGMLSVVAVRLRQMKNDVRLAPAAPAEPCVGPAMVRTLSALTGIAQEQFTGCAGSCTRWHNAAGSWGERAMANQAGRRSGKAGTNCP